MTDTLCTALKHLAGKLKVDIRKSPEEMLDSLVIFWLLSIYSLNRSGANFDLFTGINFNQILLGLTKSSRKTQILTDVLFSKKSLSALKKLKIDPDEFEAIFPHELLDFVYDEELGCDPWKISELYENFLSIRPQFYQRILNSLDLPVDLKTETKRAAGAYFTPIRIVNYLSEQAICQQLGQRKSKQEIFKLKMIDPSMGSGNFLLGALNNLVRLSKPKSVREQNSRRVQFLKKSIYGVDLNKLSVNVAYTLLTFSCIDDTGINKMLGDHLATGNSLDPNQKLLSGKIKYDIVVGNPPYVDYRSIDEKTKEYAGRFFSTSNVSRWNLYVPFIELSTSLLANNGSLGLIVPSHWLSAEFGRSLRECLIEDRAIHSIVNISKTRVFKDASTYPILLFARGRSLPSNEIKIYSTAKLSSLPDLNKIKTSWPVNLASAEKGYPIPNDYSPTEWRWFSRLEEFKSLEYYLDTMNWGTSQTGYGKKKIGRESYMKLPVEKKKKMGPIIQTADIKEMGIRWKGEYIPKGIFPDKQLDNFKRPKLVIGRMTKNLQAAYDDRGYLVGKSTIALSDDTKLLKAIAVLMSSDVINYWFKSKFGSVHMGGGYMRFDIPYLKQIPIPNLSKKDIQKLSNLYGKNRSDINRVVSIMYRLPKNLVEKSKTFAA